MTNLIFNHLRTSKVLDAIEKESVLETVLSLTHPKQHYSVVITETDYDIERFKGDAVDYENLLISTPLWANNILEFDDFSKEVSKKLIKWQDSNDIHFWDYNIESWLFEHGYDEYYKEYHSDYTYNDADNCRLDRDIHYTVFEYDYDYYVCFSIHYGTDARIGFSDSIVLKINDVDYFFSSMEVIAYDTVTDIDYQWYNLEDVASYDRETKEWHMNDTNNLVNVYSSANGY